jgi:hypothetical protein
VTFSNVSRGIENSQRDIRPVAYHWHNNISGSETDGESAHAAGRASVRIASNNDMTWLSSLPREVCVHDACVGREEVDYFRLLFKLLRFGNKAPLSRQMVCARVNDMVDR